MMKGLVIWKDGHASLEEMKKPEMGEYQALVRVTAGALCGTDKEMMDKAIEYIKTIVTDYQEGQIFQGIVVSIKEFGAFIEFAPGKEGMVHISKIAKERINHVEDVLTLGDKVTVVCLGKDKMGRMSFSMKDVAQN